MAPGPVAMEPAIKVKCLVFGSLKKLDFAFDFLLSFILNDIS